jgi:hypothetical protein
MKIQRLSLNKYILLSLAAFFIVGCLVLQYRTHASSVISQNVIASSNDDILYSSLDGQGANIESVMFASGTPQASSVLGNNFFEGASEELYLSPNRELIAVTVVPPGDDVWPFTYIANIDGSQVTNSHPGTFISWAPDSSKELLYYSPTEAPWVRKIYALDLNDNYYDFGLPNGTINADISPLDGSVLYSFTEGGSDNSTLYIRNSQGKDTLLLKGNNNIFAWARWSPTGNEIAFLKSDLSVSQGEIWTLNSDGTGLAKISNVDWDYPPVWSPDGTKIAFSNSGNIWEFNVASKSLTNATNLKQGGAEHPSYSADGQSIAFDANGQIWKASNGNAMQITNDSRQNNYPILP